MKTHYLKCWPKPFAATLAGKKVHEFRRDDGRGFEVGDVLVLQEWEQGNWHFDDTYRSGRELRRLVTFISRGPDWGIPEGFVVMSLAPGEGL